MKFHSVVGTITNSSSEIYVIKTDMSEENVMELLAEFWNANSNKPFPFHSNKADISFRRTTKYSDTLETSEGFDEGDIVFTAGYFYGFGENGYEIFPSEDEFHDKLDELFPDSWDYYEVG